MNRRHFLRFFAAFVAWGVFNPDLSFAGPDAFVTGHSDISNFKQVYGNEKLRHKFLSFLKNVYSIYPPDKFHALIEKTVQAGQSDEEIYRALQKNLPELKTLLSPLTRELPALRHQKNEMSGQVAALLKGIEKVDGYMEIGTTGRYVKGVRETVKVENQTYLLHTERPQSFSLTDIVERGQIGSVGTFVDMGEYKAIADKDIGRESLDLITNFIGFHHAHPDQRDAFIASVADRLRPGGKLLLRDHDVDGDDMRYIVALAHDVFNAGLDVAWDVNESEIRNFTSVSQIEEALHKAGMTRMGEGLRQEGDPTNNTLMLFVKT